MILCIFQLDIKIQNEAKIKEEPVNATSNTNTIEDYTLVRNSFSLTDHNYHYCDESLLSGNDVLCKNTNNTKNRYSSNNHSAHSNAIDDKIVNVEHKNAITKKKNIIPYYIPRNKNVPTKSLSIKILMCYTKPRMLREKENNKVSN